MWLKERWLPGWLVRGLGSHIDVTGRCYVAGLTARSYEVERVRGQERSSEGRQYITLHLSSCPLSQPHGIIETLAQKHQGLLASTSAMPRRI